MTARRRWLAPEVVQTSNMDCGPASLKCLLEGFGVHASYGRLREACQTDVDGTSIDTIEDVAGRLGLDASQMMVPLDYVLHPKSTALPALVVVRLPGGATHFVVAWRARGRLIQVMDPAIGRRWLLKERFLESVYLHTARVPVSSWREWASSQTALAILRTGLSDIGIEAQPFVESALKDDGWHGLATLEAGCRATRALVKAGAFQRGREAAAALTRLTADSGLIGRQYWSVESVGHDELALRGAVLVHVGGKRTVADEERLSPELAAALAERPSRPGLELWRLVREDGLLTPSIVAAGLATAAAGVVLEAVLLRSLIDVGHDLPLAGQRTAAVAALLAFLLVLLVLDARLATLIAGLGRRLDLRLRLALLKKIPRLTDRYFQSRLQSDMAERSHVAHRVRGIPDLAARLTRLSFELLFTTAGIAWIDPTAAPLAVCAATAAAAVPWLAQPTLTERDLRVRTHTGALCRFYLDALLGLTPIRTHGGERAVRRAHGYLLGEWANAGLALQRTAVRVEGVQLALVLGFAVWAMLSHAAKTTEAGSVLLLVYWLLSLPAIGDDIAPAAWQYPSYRNTALRVLEPLGALESRPSDAVNQAVQHTPVLASRRVGVAVKFDRVSVRAAGHEILNDIDLDIPAGSHVAILGASGAGKSSVAGVLLGWHRPAEGTVLVDDTPLDGCLEALRRDTAWVDPSVQLWNQSVTDNLRYGGSAGDIGALGGAIEKASLWNVIQKLPDSMDTPLGEGGALVSGGEGQRVRLGRAMMKSQARLVILDEPFRGLASTDRRELLERARRQWRHATLLCITHDIAHTKDFDRVVILESGRVVEEGSPAVLAASSGSRYRAMLEAERSTQQALWNDGAWRRARLERGHLHFFADGSRT